MNPRSTYLLLGRGALRRLGRQILHRSRPPATFMKTGPKKYSPTRNSTSVGPIHKPAVYDRLKEANAVFGASFGLEHVNWFADKPKRVPATA